MKLSVVIPSHNEEACIEETVLTILTSLKNESIDFELLVVDDHNTDSTNNILKHLELKHPEFRFIENTYPHGFGFAVKSGLESISGDAVVIVMADASDNPEDIIRFFRKLEEGYDCVFGSRFTKGGSARNYPAFKLAVNRLANFFIKILFGIRYNDTTNAFKMYRRETIAVASRPQG